MHEREESQKINLLKILRAFCVNKDQPFKEHQKLIHDLFFF